MLKSSNSVHWSRTLNAWRSIRSSSSSTTSTSCPLLVRPLLQRHHFGRDVHSIHRCPALTMINVNNTSSSSLMSSTTGRRYVYTPPSWETDLQKKLQDTVTSTQEQLQDEKGKNQLEGILWVSNLYPIKISRLDFRSLLFKIPITQKLMAIFPEDIEVISIEKRLKEGGAYVHFRKKNPAEGETIESLAAELSQRFVDADTHFHMASSPARAILVLGQPFVEDIDDRLPSFILKVYCKGAELNVDDIFRLLRPYGHIVHIERPTETPKDGQKYTLVAFSKVEGAIAARNCLHNKYFPDLGTTFIMTYESMRTIVKIRDVITNNPKFMIPLIGVLATLITLFLFDPLRKYYMNKSLSTPLFFDEVEEWQTRYEEKLLDSHFNYPPNSIVMISAPKGSGKSSLIDKTLEGRQNTLLVDCSAEVNSSDEEFIENLSKDIGFFPSYGLYTNALGWMDAVLPSSGKGGLHQSTAGQLQTILKLLDQCLEEKAVTFPEDPHQAFPYPLIVIDGFFGAISAIESKEKARAISDAVIQWSITTTLKGNAHVVFISSDPFAGDVLKKYLENRGGQSLTIHLGDVPPNSAKNYIRHRLGRDLSEGEYSSIIDTLGGRYSDLNYLSQRMTSGEPVRAVLNSMVARAVGDIRSDGFGLSRKDDDKGKGGVQLKWTRTQVWETIKRVAQSKLVSYDDLLFNVFNGDETALNNIITSGILGFSSHNNERVVTAYSPLYNAAFKQMVEDIEFCVGMDIFTQKARIDEEMTKLNKVEEELIKLKTLSSSKWFEGDTVKVRRQLLEEKMIDHVSKIEGREKILQNHTQFQKFISTKKTPSTDPKATYCSSDDGMAQHAATRA
ncbi:hypothetical protein SAMD00019534_017660 [Acytostelium subglobosum LB1]|uniref:hypothetical protein n=1 Tax=Acytostelium subglobosum LB1 TaxID=1410327 RepID=UPI000644E6BA|nr:hypothetical protein SAMD00019534_017660 [Acytostelium subglobosum LB1]GAM18591.1 hypothetical protein SAMD00019534_017660 [Acytostelium subglobosum LB1]|eukprot:XP_012757811.1 hypothetical protein SAMD00019534_017660 [Acytostelium subglobosum LB1]